ncbi:MAG: hypothetical protein WBC78_01585, partial [Candidatus Sulfotelmatobacter sp.]
IRTVVSLNPIMIDGTGRCGGCRVPIDGKSEFACVDGPEFDAHKVNFEVLVQRNGMYRDAEQRSLAEFQQVTAEKTAAEKAQGRETQTCETQGCEIHTREIQEPCAIAPGGKR